MNLTIRPFNLQDYDIIIKLWNEANLPVRPEGRDSREKIGEQIKQGTSIFLVAESDNEIVGTVLGTHDGRKGWVNRLAVSPKCRRHNIATMLIRELESKFESMGLEVTACLIEEENKVSMEFFKELGYAEWNGKYFSKRKRKES